MPFVFGCTGQNSSCIAPMDRYHKNIQTGIGKNGQRYFILKGISYIKMDGIRVRAVKSGNNVWEVSLYPLEGEKFLNRKVYYGEIFKDLRIIVHPVSLTKGKKYSISISGTGSPISYIEFIH